VSRFEILKLLHVLGAIVWVGAGAGLVLLGQRMRADQDRDGLRALGRSSAALGKTLFAPAALVTLLAGVLMVATESRFAFSDLWIVIGLVGVLISFVLGAVLAEPTDTKLAALLEDHDVGHPEVAATLARSVRLSSIELGVMLIVVWAMVAQPML
jgi:putative copper export protein